uniref:WRKY transcription factor n=1 Tax=Papaver somniferum TaxID=3469 RepID=M4H1Q1_PAPSO|nr:WRKY transcription factor [Papaver somniferum]
MGSSNSSNNYQKEIKQEEEKKITDFSFRPSVTDTPLQSGDSESDYKHYPHQPIQTLREQKRSEDGYNWRKYGQKQVKGSEDPRSYYKCTYQNCPMKKKVEISFDGRSYGCCYKQSKDSHNHPKPQPSKKSLASAASQLVQQPSVSSNSYSQTVSVSTQDNNSSTSVDDDEFDNTSLKRSKSGTTGDLDESEPKSKKWKNEGENEVLSGYGNSRVVKEPKVVVQTTSDIDILDDGFRWRKYGQKVVRGNPNPRSYYKCTSLGCAVRKHVERAANNIRSVITTYEGKHNYDIPAARGSYRHSSNNNTSSSITNVAMSTSSNEQVPYTLEMMQNSENYEYGSYMNQQHNLENTFSETKSEPMKDDVLLELLY